MNRLDEHLKHMFKHRDGSYEYPQYMFWLRNKKNNFQLRSLIWGPVNWLSQHVDWDVKLQTKQKTKFLNITTSIKGLKLLLSSGDELILRSRLLQIIAQHY